MNEAPYSTNFVLHRNGLRCQHTVRSVSSIEEHVALVDAALAAFAAAGHTITEAGLEEGQESQNVDGYVVGTTGKGHKVLWFYANHLEFGVRGGAVYDDHWDELPFTPTWPKLFEGEQKPSTEYAKSNGFFVPYKARIVIRQTEKTTKKGEPIWRFVSIVSASANGAAPKATAPEPAEPPADADALCNRIIGYLTNKVETPQNLVDASLRAFAQKKNLSAECWELVQKNVRARLVLFVNEASSDTEREELEAAVRAIGKVLPDGIADRYLTELAAAKSSNVPF